MYIGMYACKNLYCAEYMGHMGYGWHTIGTKIMGKFSGKFRAFPIISRNFVRTVVEIQKGFGDVPRLK